MPKDLFMFEKKGRRVKLLLRLTSNSLTPRLLILFTCVTPHQLNIYYLFWHSIGGNKQSQILEKQINSMHFSVGGRAVFFMLRSTENSDKGLFPSWNLDCRFFVRLLCIHSWIITLSCWKGLMEVLLPRQYEAEAYKVY